MMICFALFVLTLVAVIFDVGCLCMRLVCDLWLFGWMLWSAFVVGLAWWVCVSCALLAATTFTACT